MATKKARDLGFADLGKQVRYEHANGSVTVGMLDTISMYRMSGIILMIDGAMIHNVMENDVIEVAATAP